MPNCVCPCSLDHPVIEKSHDLCVATIDSYQEGVEGKHFVDMSTRSKSSAYFNNFRYR